MRTVFNPLFLVLILGVMVLPVMAFTGTGWLPEYSTQLGIRAADAPAPSDEFSEFETLIEDPDKFREVAEIEVEAGVKVIIIHAGNMRWSSEVQGIPVNPAAFRVKVEGVEQVLTFLPERETSKLKLYRRPPFRSSSAPRSNQGL